MKTLYTLSVLYKPTSPNSWYVPWKLLKGDRTRLQPWFIIRRVSWLYIVTYTNGCHKDYKGDWPHRGLLYLSHHQKMISSKQKKKNQKKIWWSCFIPHVEYGAFRWPWEPHYFLKSTVWRYNLHLLKFKMYSSVSLESVYLQVITTIAAWNISVTQKVPFYLLLWSQSPPPTLAPAHHWSAFHHYICAF